MGKSKVVKKKETKKKLTKQVKVKEVAKAATGQSELNAQQELFCQLFASDREFFCNGVQSYLEAYDLPTSKYKSAASRATMLLKQQNIQKRINDLIELGDLNDGMVDKQLAKVIAQDIHFPAKVQAIREYNALKKRITNVVEHRFGDMEQLTDEEIAQRKAEALKFFGKGRPLVIPKDS